MFRWLKSVRERRAKRRAERKATAGERALQQNEANAQRLSHERMGGKDPMAPGM
jgi:hypothetical protein